MEWSFGSVCEFVRVIPALQQIREGFFALLELLKIKRSPELSWYLKPVWWKLSHLCFQTLQKAVVAVDIRKVKDLNNSK